MICAGSLMVVREGTDNRPYLSHLLNVYSLDNFYLTEASVGGFHIEILQFNINIQFIENE